MVPVGWKLKPNSGTRLKTKWCDILQGQWITEAIRYRFSRPTKENIPCRVTNLTLEPSRKEEYAPKQRANTGLQKKKNLLFTNLLFTNPKNRLVILNKISKFGENYSLWQVTGIKKKKKPTVIPKSKSSWKPLYLFIPWPCRRCKGKHLHSISPQACTELKLFPLTSI